MLNIRLCVGVRLRLLLLSLIHLSLDLFRGEAMHKLASLGGKLGVFFWGADFVDVDLCNVSCHGRGM